MFQNIFTNISDFHTNFLVTTLGAIKTNSFEDNFANGPFGSCTFIADTLVIDSIYRMHLTSDDWNCFGDIQFQ